MVLFMVLLRSPATWAASAIRLSTGRWAPAAAGSSRCWLACGGSTMTRSEAARLPAASLGSSLPVLPALKGLMQGGGTPQAQGPNSRLVTVVAAAAAARSAAWPGRRAAARPSDVLAAPSIWQCAPLRSRMGPRWMETNPQGRLRSGDRLLPVRGTLWGDSLKRPRLAPAHPPYASLLMSLVATAFGIHGGAHIQALTS